MSSVTWHCESCNTDNIDQKQSTQVPSCRKCSTSYSWEDILHLSDDADGYFNFVDSLSMKKHGLAAVDLVDEPDAVIHSLQESFSSNVKPEAALRKVRVLQARELWEKFGDTPVNDEDEIEESFLNFEVGTDRFEIWHWFEDLFDLSVQNDLVYSDQ